MTLWLAMSITFLSLGAVSPGVSIGREDPIVRAVGSFHIGENDEQKEKNQPFPLEGSSSRLAKKDDRQPGLQKRKVEG